MRGSLEQQLERKLAFVQELKCLPVAVQTAAANEQHYEVGGKSRGRQAFLAAYSVTVHRSMNGRCFCVAWRTATIASSTFVAMLHGMAAHQHQSAWHCSRCGYYLQ
eukprot:GHRQ01027541.1.p2 GENE.GHRQ01027541.1~~GHRQ01027541.1.p2  ORF type:complete len:106 (-),score=22.10 GHRQ01027541.1:357-674(-)